MSVTVAVWGFSWLWDKLVGLWDTVTEWVASLFSSLMQTIGDMLVALGFIDPAEFESAIGTFEGYWAGITWVVPIGAMMTTVFAGLMTAFTIRGIRWVLHVAPWVG